MTTFDADRPLRVAALFSGGASAVRHLVDRDPNSGDPYEFVGAIASDPDAPGIDALESRNVEVEPRDIEAFYEDRDADLRDMAVREVFDRGTCDLLSAWNPDLVILSGYMWILTDPVVAQYPVLNVHPADLTVTDDEGDRKYVGADPVRDAILEGADRTRSSVHYVVPEVDEGPILVLSKPFPVHRDMVEGLETNDAGHALENYVDAHQEWMKWDGDGPAYAKALELIAEGRVRREGDVVYVDGDPGPVERDGQ
jgi:folate-dependent phosphoribosylglycinamide formyltransferase PurN